MDVFKGRPSVCPITVADDVSVAQNMSVCGFVRHTVLFVLFIGRDEPERVFYDTNTRLSHSHAQFLVAISRTGSFSQLFF